MNHVEDYQLQDHLDHCRHGVYERTWKHKRREELIAIRLACKVPLIDIGTLALIGTVPI